MQKWNCIVKEKPHFPHTSFKNNYLKCFSPHTSWPKVLNTLYVWILISASICKINNTVMCYIAMLGQWQITYMAVCNKHLGMWLAVWSSLFKCIPSLSDPWLYPVALCLQFTFKILIYFSYFFATLCSIKLIFNAWKMSVSQRIWGRFNRFVKFKQVFKWECY